MEAVLAQQKRSGGDEAVQALARLRERACSMTGREIESMFDDTARLKLKADLEDTPVSMEPSAKLRVFRSLLNKLSPRNESVIVEQLTRLHPSSFEELADLADLVFKQTLRDPSRRNLYGRAIATLNAAFSRLLHSGPELSDGDPTADESVSTRAMTLEAHVVRFCQAEFERVYSELLEIAGSSLTGSGIQLVRLQGTLQSSAERLLEAKDSALACMAVVGELVLCQVMSVRILGHVVSKLLLPGGKTSRERPQGLPPEPFVECACELLGCVIGNLPNEAEALKVILARLAWLREQLVKDIPQFSHSSNMDLYAYAYSARLRFIILDLMEAAHLDGPDQKPPRRS